MSQLATAFDLYLQQSPPPLIPDPGPGQLPGRLGEDSNTVVAVVKAGLIVLAVLVGLAGAGMIMAGQKNRSGYATSGLEKVLMVVLGLGVMGSIASIVGLFV